jgi:hypothetical protein
LFGYKVPSNQLTITVSEAYNVRHACVCAGDVLNRGLSVVMIVTDSIKVAPGGNVTAWSTDEGKMHRGITRAPAATLGLFMLFLYAIGITYFKSFMHSRSFPSLGKKGQELCFATRTTAYQQDTYHRLTVFNAEDDCIYR